jgi:Carboxymuconolactone decarboxylase family.
MVLENRIKALIAVGASVSANCHPCLQSASAMAMASGADEQQIVAALEIGKKVRAGGAFGMDNFILELDHKEHIPGNTSAVVCGCVSD